MPLVLVASQPPKTLQTPWSASLFPCSKFSITRIQSPDHGGPNVVRGAILYQKHSKCGPRQAFAQSFLWVNRSSQRSCLSYLLSPASQISPLYTVRSLLMLRSHPLTILDSTFNSPHPRRLSSHVSPCLGTRPWSIKRNIGCTKDTHKLSSEGGCSQPSVV